jgi:hypothetical protein
LTPTRILAATLALAFLSPAALAFGLPPEPSPPPLDDPAATVMWGIDVASGATAYAIETASEAGIEALTAYEQTTTYAFCKLQSRAGCQVSLDATVERDTFYVGAGHSVGEPASVWQETNGCEGLQRDALDDCAADTRLA